MTQPTPPFQNDAVKNTFAGFSETVRPGLLELRRLIFDVAETENVGRIEETLKWGQPAYLTPESKSGTTLRLGVPKAGGYALFVHCQTTIIPDARAVFADAFTYDGNRAVLFNAQSEIAIAPLALLIAQALTYHRRNKKGPR
ncbi:hypothetical protein DSM14862_00510 [Sulfitobacter indolifex]|uniref:YdhG-like domain-containing protein n=1 Tax=Sulfitobacter indolifex HEL-45 TaxID=391624 RepID=A0ABM9XBP0_9RHOB|nr:DUF1801 domain-containing protein [Sulfitobacter indolifex]EDQ06767.1 hypothetical protein OIHEL45_08115 [Sulfitobacter indolifex HEL-45]UOA17753.1 hypothetical protein DSM14862_00510 [Sulfitobacter indolifex]